MDTRQLGHYEILQELGSGATGDVYLARDVRLGREVAIKVLRPDLADDPERLRRFEHEARTASALHHPNIVTIHDIAEADGVHFIVMEYVAGRTLRQLMRSGPLRVRDAVRYAIQMADGLAGAHKAGVVHRDLKPENVLVSHEGLVKIADFGLAKLLEPREASTMTCSADPTSLTAEGHVVGTLPYMSPEQVQGFELDPRSDIYAFGLVLYEMVTGRRAFAQTNSALLVSAIVHDMPEAAGRMMPSLPLELDRLITRAVRKEPDRRFQSAADVRVELQEIADELSSGRVVSVAHAGRSAVAPPRRWLLLATAALVAGGGLTTWLLAPSRAVPDQMPLPVPFTSFPGSEQEPAIAPDGRLVAFVWDRGIEGSAPQLYVKMAGSGDPLQLTRGTAAASQPAWSPDGREIAFLRGASSGGFELCVVPALGGAARQLTHVFPQAYPGLDWSPQHDLFAVVDRGTTSDAESIFLFSIGTGTKRRLTEPPSTGMGDRTPAFSPDGREVAFVRWREAPFTEIFVTPIAGGPLRAVASYRGYVRDLAWRPDGSALVFAAYQSGQVGQLWTVDANGGTPERLAYGELARELAIARQTGSLVYAQTHRDANIWRAPGPLGASGEPLRRIVASSRDDWAPHLSPDGSRLAFASDRTGTTTIWTCASGGEDCTRAVASDGASTPRWSPDGRRLAYSGEVDGNVDAYVVDIQSGVTTRLTDDPAADLPFSWSIDGSWVYFNSDRTGRFEVWVVPAGGGLARQRSTDGGLLPQVSADGRYLYYLKWTSPASIWRMPIDGGAEQLVHQAPLVHTDYALWNGSLLYATPDDDGGLSIRRYDMAADTVLAVARVGPERELGRYGRLAVSPDGRWVFFPREEGRGSDLMIVERAR